MRTRHLIDPELIAPAEAFPGLQFSADALPHIREMAAQLFAVPVDLDAHGVTCTNVLVTGAEGHPDVPCLLYQPTNGPRNSAAYLQIHGGGFLIGAAKDSEARNAALSALSSARLGSSVGAA